MPMWIGDRLVNGRPFSMLVVTDTDDSATGLERQRAEVEAAFRHGWTTVMANRRRVLSAADFRQAQKVIAGEVVLTGMDPAMIRAVRHGARPGDALPPPERRPFIVGVGDDAEVVISGSGADRRVAVLFSYQAWPGRRFGYRFSPPSSRTARYGPIWLKEEIETGALHRMMQSPPAGDEAGVIWCTW